MVRIFLVLLAVMGLAAWGGGQKGPLDPETQARVAYKAADAPSITLLTSVRKQGGGGTHSALMVSGSQRVIFDPAGSFRAGFITAYGDVFDDAGIDHRMMELRFDT